MPKLTQNYVKSLPLSKDTSQKIYLDDELTGFGVRVSKRSKVFYVYMQFEGKVKKRKLGEYGLMTVDQARKEAVVMKGKVLAGQDPYEERRNGPSAETLRQIFDEHKAKKNKASTISSIDAAMKKFGPLKGMALKTISVPDSKAHRGIRQETTLVEVSLPDWLGRKYRDITEHDVAERFKKLSGMLPSRKLSDPPNPITRTANRTFKWLQAVYTAEIERKRLKKTGFENPVDVLTREDLWGEENERKTVLNLDLPEFHKWWEACKQLTPSVIGDYFMFTLLTGSRSVEAATLEWKTVDLDAGKMTFEDTKNRKDYTFPIAPETRKILERRLKEKINTYVFGYAESATGHVVCPPQHAIKQVRDESGAYWCMHDLRRTFATSLVELGVHPFAVMKLMKHREPSVTFGYVQPTHEQFLAIFTNYENHVLTKAKRQ